MKKYALLSLLIFVLSVVLIVGGCSENSPIEPDQNGEVAELDKPYGGFETTDELPAFGDPEMSVAYGDDENVEDLVTLDPAFTNALHSDTVNAYYIRITWGLLEGDSTATQVINWDGSASITRGKLGIMKTILSEGNDRITLPRSDHKTVQWISNTGPHYDGILLVIVDKDTSKVPGEFTFTSNLYTRTFTYDELDSLYLVETVTPQDHQILFQAYNRRIIPFGGGFLEGNWIKNRQHGGFFKGRWINNVGTRVGHLKGIWGVNRFGEQVFYGKYINFNGQFGGLLAGKWEYNDQDENKGWFKGRWVNHSLTGIGTLEGHWKTKDDSTQRGFFNGKWKRSN
jgi:hypothetical protein